MGLVLLMELVLALGLVLILGFRLEKWRGALALAEYTILPLLGLLVVMVLAWRLWDIFPLHQIPAANWLPFNYVGMTLLVMEISLWTLVLSAFIGYFFNGRMGAWLLTDSWILPIPTLTVLLGIGLGWLGISQSGLLIVLAALGVGCLTTWLTTTFAKIKRVWPFLVVWLTFYLFCAAGYAVAGRIGLLLLTLPALALFFYLLYTYAGLILPSQPDQQRDIFQSLLTFGLGTNYPFYLVDDWKTQAHKDRAFPPPRVAGNPFGQFLAGPGIILNDCNHVAVVYEANRYRLLPPGLNFTRQYEQFHTSVDLRPQLRITTVEAETKDGIVTKTLVFMPHRIQNGGHEPQLGQSYPYDPEAILKVISQQAMVEHRWQRDPQGVASEELHPIPWDERVVPVGTAVLKELIVQYTCNELHTPGDPRVKIADAFRGQLRQRLPALGIDLVGGGLSNIKPPESVEQQRIANWQAKWKKRIEMEIGLTEAEITRQLEKVWPEVQLDIIRELAQILSQAGTVRDDLLALQLVESLGAIPPKEASEPSQPEIPYGFLRALMRRGR